MKKLDDTVLTSISGSGVNIIWPALEGFAYFAIPGVILNFYTSNPNWILPLGLVGAAIFCSRADLDIEAEKK